jgi:phage shock protein C
MIDGVCGGVAGYFSIDPTLIRIAWVILTLAGGSGIVLYIIAMIVMPTEPATVSHPNSGKSSTANQKFWGFLLVTVGILWLAGNLGFSFWRHWWGISWDMLLPVVLLLAGVAFLFGGRNYVSNTAPTESGTADATGGGQPVTPSPVSPARLRRSRSDRKMFGVCGGLGTYFNIDSSIVRILFVVAVLASFGIGVFAYFLMAVVIPEEPLPAAAI